MSPEADWRRGQLSVERQYMPEPHVPSQFEEASYKTEVLQTWRYGTHLFTFY